MNSIDECNIHLLKDGSKLYYQFNCDSVWLTLEKKSGRKIIIYSMAGDDFKELYGYNYRLGYQFAHEYNKSILFRSGCPANGPCNFILINKSNGKITAELGELIYNREKNKFYNFLVYFSNEKLNYLIIYYPDSGKRYKIHIHPYDFRGVIPEYTINDITVKNHILKLTTQSKKKIVIDLSKYSG
jgi:hypothetical protein